MNYPIDIIMKMNLLKKTAAGLVIAAISFAGYASTPEYAIAMTTAIADEVEFLMAGTGMAVIDRGDGSDPETVSLSAFEERFTDLHLCAHTFPETAARTIAIDGQGITHAAYFLMYLTALDVTNDTALTYLNCGNNLLASLDVTKNTGLTFLDCGNNKLTNLDVTGNTGLKGLRCYKNQLTSLDVSNNAALKLLSCQKIGFTAEGLNSLYGKKAVRKYCLVPVNLYFWMFMKFSVRGGKLSKKRALRRLPIIGLCLRTDGSSN